MKYVVITIMCLLIAVTANAETRRYKLSYAAPITSTGDANAPDVCKVVNVDRTLSDTDCNIPTGKNFIIEAQLDTTDTDNTSTSVDLNFKFDDDTESYACISALGDNKKKTCLIESTVGSITFDTDCNATNCDPIIWIEVGN